MVAPDVEIDDGKGTILISSEEGETDGEYSSWSVSWLRNKCYIISGDQIKTHHS